MVSVTYRGQTFTGRTADTIARREFHPSAYVRTSCDPNSMGDAWHLAMVVRRDQHGTHVLASVVIHETGE